MKTHQQPATLVVMLRDAEWPGWLQPCQSNANAVVVAQSPGETPEQFYGRLQRRIPRLSSASSVLETIVISVGKLEPHQPLLECLKQQLEPYQVVQLFLTTSAVAAPELRAHLMEEWARYCDCLGDSVGEIQLSFESVSPASGIFPRSTSTGNAQTVENFPVGNSLAS